MRLLFTANYTFTFDQQKYEDHYSSKIRLLRGAQGAQRGGGKDLRVGSRRLYPSVHLPERPRLRDSPFLLGNEGVDAHFPLLPAVVPHPGLGGWKHRMQQKLEMATKKVFEILKKVN